MRVQTRSVHFHADAKLLAYVDAKISRLQKVAPSLLEAEVFLRLENAGQVRDKIVEVKLKAPGTTFFEKKTSKTFEGAIDNISRSLREQVVRQKEKRAER